MSAKPAAGAKIGPMEPRFSLTWKSILPIGLAAVGLILVAIQLTGNLLDGLSTLGISVDRPQRYEFTHFDRALRSCVRGRFVDYACLQQSEDFRKALEEIRHISPERLDYPDGALAFWINTYNMLVLKNILDRYPIADLSQLGQTTSMRRFVVGGKLYTIQDISIDVISPLATTHDARIIFLVCNGAQGSPPLPDHAITAESLKQDADLAARNFTLDPRNTGWDPMKGIFYASRFYKSAEPAIKPQYGNIWNFINSYLPDREKVNPGDPGERLKFRSSFNTRLNDAALAAQVQPRPFDKTPHAPEGRMPSDTSATDSGMNAKRSFERLPYE